MAAYCVFMGRRLAEMRRVLKPTGGIYLHCDPHASAYLRILDAIFGERQFQNETVWERIKGAGKTSQHGYRSFGRSSDSLLFYSASDKYHFDIGILNISWHMTYKVAMLGCSLAMVLVDWPAKLYASLC